MRIFYEKVKYSNIFFRYRWTLLKALEFLSYRRPDLEIRSTFIQQLAAYETRLTKVNNLQITSTWKGNGNK